MSDYPSEETANDDARRAYNWGIFTWVGNIAGCGIALIPIAIPIGILLTIFTLGTGFGAMMYGTRGKAQAKIDDDDNSLWHARVGWWLGMSHLIIVAVVVLVVFLVLSAQRPG
jgi:hypothetical protein